MAHTPTPWFALSGGYISTSVVADWASKEKYIGMAATDSDAQRICLAHNAATSSANEKSNDEGEKIVRAISSANEKRSEAPVNGYEALKEALELAGDMLSRAFQEACDDNRDQDLIDEYDAAMQKINKALALTTLERSEKVK